MQIENKKTTINKETVSKSKPYNFLPKRDVLSVEPKQFSQQMKEIE